MAFKKIASRSPSPDTPDLLFRDLPRRKLPDVLPHQKEIMELYASHAENESDVALQLPTGSGKTLVGLLIAEWRRRKNKEKIVYLCPTRQLVYQTVNQAEKIYGLSVVGFTGQNKDYSASDKTKYKQADNVSITTYSSIFNTNSFFSDADVIILDDAHAAENYVATLWTLRIYRNKNDVLYNLVIKILHRRIDHTSYTRIIRGANSEPDFSWVDKIPTPTLLEVHDGLLDILDEHTTTNNELFYPWKMLRDNLKSCHLYVSCSEITIRPIITPTWDLPAFEKPKQRIYMSATLGEGGDLERLMGRKHIFRLPTATGSDHQGVGRRFFMFPELSLDNEKQQQLRLSLLREASRSLILTPSEGIKNNISEHINNKSSLTVFDITEIEKSKEDFVNSDNSVVVACPFGKAA